MKIPVFLTCLAAVVLAAMPVRQARADDVSFDVFYNNLADDGDWYNTPEFGYVWHPTVADKSDKWRPYTDGYWAQTDDGWTWVSYENFGWATYHYGRWTRLKDTGWVWVPGYDWGPGWVSWRTSDEDIGWAPLPPKVQQGYVEGAPAPVQTTTTTTVDYNAIEPADYGPDVDVQYDIGPENYCFVQTRNFGAPVLAEVLLPPQQNIVIIERTVNVTNIYRPPGGPGGGFVVYNRGPDFNFINAHVERPIQVLRIERHNDVTFLNNGIHGGANVNVVRGGVFTVAAPPIARGPINFAQVKPVRVKQTIEKTEIVHGWSNSGADAATVQRLRTQFKEQAQKAPLPPHDANPPRPEQLTREPQRNEASQPPKPENNPRAEQNQPPASGNGQPTPARARGPKPNNGQPAATPAPGGNNDGQPLTPEERQARRAQRQQGGQPAPESQNPSAGNNPASDNNPERDARRAQRQQGKAPQGQQPDATPAPQANPDRDARRQQRQQDKAPQDDQGQKPAQQDNPDRDARRPQRQPEKAQQDDQGQKPSSAQPDAQNPDRDARRAPRQQDKPQQPQGDQDSEGQKQPAQNPNHEDRRAERQPDQQPRNTPQASNPQAKGSDKSDSDKKKKNQPDQ